ncbi:tyrosine-type recombinase/integrase [Clostridium beijerinckii]|uniref:Tyr recombinase domain-containing protein n=1 Tax=Clostridium beijerinckii TaxID=1520 RepID=A0A1S9N9Z0_CLOBE|nr:tyrosine-type recombinase/integrase [Clostridium beijerinckii]OOP74268.1 hypothetical protein CBEIBR21_07165 [Clostridium beijerinckii]
MNIKRPILKDYSFKKWDYVYKKYIKTNENLSNSKLVNLDTAKLQEITDELLKKCTLSQVRTINNYLSNCFMYAKSINMVKFNPVENIIYPKVHNTVRGKENNISEYNPKYLLNTLSSNELNAILLMKLICNIRLDEAMALQIKDVDFNQMTIKINKSLKYVSTSKKTKEDKIICQHKPIIIKAKTCIREVPLPIILKSFLPRLIENNMINKLKLKELYHDNDLIFCNQNGTYFNYTQQANILKSR